MAISYRNISVLAAGNENTLLYLCPVDKQSVISSFWVCNQGSSEARFRLAVVQPSGTVSVNNYRYYNKRIPSYDTFVATTGISLAEGATIWVWSSSGNLSFSLDIAEMDV